MNRSRTMQKNSLSLLIVVLTFTSVFSLAATRLPVSKTADQDALEQKKEAQEDAVEIEGDIVPASVQEAIDMLPEDTTPRFEIREVALTGNTLFSSEQLLSDVPAVYNSSKDGSVESAFLYDLRPLQELAAVPGAMQSVSARTIQGFTQYILSIYQDKNYAGIYVYVPTEAFEAGNQLEQGILPIRVLEAPVTKISSTYSDAQSQPVEEGYLKASLLEGWSPIQEGEVANRKALDDYLNLLNQNPDRYVGATVSKGDEPETLAVTYNVFEAKPEHFFIQLDNSGTDDIQWKPRFGYINTNLLGFDDKLTAIYQSPMDSQWDEEYALYGAYDFPILGPRLRLNLYAGYNEFDIADGAINFLGRGQFYGGTLRYNAFQKNDWFFDVTGGLRYEETKSTPSLEPDLFGSDVRIYSWNYGVQMYQTTDMMDTFLGFEQVISIDGSSQEAFDQSRISLGGADRDFNIYTTTARHSRYLDSTKIQRASGSFKYITSDERLTPAKMTSFGGMYTVRGYDEYEVTADGGILASVQYEYDLIRKSTVELYGEETEEEARQPFLRKLAPLVFVDYGIAKTEDAEATEPDNEELCSWGGGIITELGENFSGTVYYGYPLIATDNTRSGKGRVHVGLLFRW